MVVQGKKVKRGKAKFADYLFSYRPNVPPWQSFRRRRKTNLAGWVNSGNHIFGARPMPTIPEALAVALQHHQAGRLREAEPIYRQILAADPNHHDAWHLLGVIACQDGRHQTGVECIRRALACRPTWPEAHYDLGNAWEIQGKLDDAAAAYQRARQLKPDFIEAHNNLGNVLKLQGKTDEAGACYRQALQWKPDYALAQYNLGLVCRDQGKMDEAVASYQRALQLQPDFAEAQNGLGSVYKEQGKLDEAGACFQRALQLQPDFAEAHCNLGVVCHDQGKLDQAVACCLRALQLQPDCATAHYNLGTLFKDQGKLDEAVPCYQRALQLQPDYPLAHYNLGVVCQGQGKLEEALACYQRALRLQPNLPEAHNNLGNVCLGLGMLGEAVACYRRTVQERPDYAEAHNNLGNAFKYLGKMDGAVACYQRALELKPDFAAVHSNLLLTLQYRFGVTLPELAAVHAEYDRLHAAPLRGFWPRHANDRDPLRRLRVGFVSADFGRHPVGYFLIRALENLDQGQCKTVCYCERIIKDDLTQRFQAVATTWRSVSGLSDQRLTEQIVEDRIDILFDLTGHTAHNRLLMFARKPAPVQVTWAGYVGTTGLEAMDYILADHHEIPPGAEAHYCEKVLRMPDGYVSYDPPSYAPSVAPLPAVKRGYVTFGSFNNRVKIDPRTVEAWAKILGRVRHSRLVLKYKGMGDKSLVTGLVDEFARHKVDPGRLECLEQSAHPALLSEYNRIDLALDPLPYNGGLTTCEALWMGVPVLTCPGETFASRHSLSHLSTVGLTETIARTLDEYVDLAVTLASDLSRLASLRPVCASGWLPHRCAMGSASPRI